VTDDPLRSPVHSFLWLKENFTLFFGIKKTSFITLFFGAQKTSLSLFSLAQRKETKETSTLTRPSPIWEGSTAPTRRSFTKVSSPHQRGGLIFLSAYAMYVDH